MSHDCEKEGKTGIFQVFLFFGLHAHSLHFLGVAIETKRVLRYTASLILLLLVSTVVKKV